MKPIIIYCRPFAAQFHKDNGNETGIMQTALVIVARKKIFILLHDAKKQAKRAKRITNRIITVLIHLLRDYDYSNVSNPYSGACYAQGFVYIINKCVTKK